VGGEAEEVDVSLLDWAVENVKVWTNSSVLTTSGHGPDFCHPGAVPSGAEFVTRQQWLSAKERKNMVEWNGEGLPPVGCECELYDSESGWEVVFVKYVGNKTVVVDLLDGDEYSFELSTCEFRPLRTEAERKREEAIAALKQLNPQLVGELAGYLYDEIAAGKIPHITLK